MTDYIVVKEDTLDLLIEMVNQNIVEGYTTIGGINTVDTYYLQAMARLDYKI
jgi:hypothetical protein